MGWDEKSKQTNHTELMKYVKGMSRAELSFVKKDCEEAIKANPDNPKNGHYMDTIHYICMRLSSD
jgi:hypothetical protein